MGGRTERDSAAVGVVGNVCNFPFYGAVGNVVCRMWESCFYFSICCE